MSFIEVESLIHRKGSNVYGKHRRAVALTAVVLATTVLVATTLLGFNFVKGYTHFGAISVSDPMSTAISIRPNYPVSTFIYDKRNIFDWFLSTSAAIVGGALAMGGIGFGCVVVTGGTLIAGCVVAAVGAGFTVASTIATTIQGRRLRNARQAMLYMGYEDKSSKRSLDAHAAFELEHREALDSIFGAGSNYAYESTITANDTHNANLVARNGGAPVHVFSFTTPDGIPLHHAMITDEAGHNFHRFGFSPTAHTKRDEDVAPTHEYFKSDGIDILDCWGGDTEHLENSNLDNGEMQKAIICNVPKFNQTTELAAQVYDATKQETIGAGRIAPFGPNGGSVLLDSQYSACPEALTGGNPSCPHYQQTS